MGLPPAGAPPPSLARGDRAPAASLEDPSILAFQSKPRSSLILGLQIPMTQPGACPCGGSPD